MTELVGYMALFVVVAVFFVFIHLVAGRFIRPVKPDPEKSTIYECGEPTIGSSWIQFDLRFYVVALLFVIFDVEVAFFFPWAVVFGKVNALAKLDENDPQRSAIVKELVPADPNRSATECSGCEEVGLAGVLGPVGVLWRSARRVCIPVEARRFGLGPQHGGRTRRGKSGGARANCGTGTGPGGNNERGLVVSYTV